MARLVVGHACSGSEEVENVKRLRQTPVHFSIRKARHSGSGELKYTCMGKSNFWTNTENFLLLNVVHTIYVICEVRKAN